MTKTLQLYFETAAGKKVTLPVDHPRDNLTPEEVTSAMQIIIASGAFLVDGYPLESATGARIVERHVTELVKG